MHLTPEEFMSPAETQEATQVATRPSFNDLITYDVAQADIARMRERCMLLKVAGVDDKDGYEACHKARMEVKAKRVAVDKRRKELKADSLEFGRRVDSYAKQLTEPLKEIEDHLEAQQKIVDDEKERIKQEAARIAKERLDSRIATMQRYGAPICISTLTFTKDDAFDVMAAEAKERFEKKQEEEREQARKLAELEAEKARHAEELRQERAKIEALQAELAAKQKAEVEAARAAAKEEQRKAREAKEAELEAARKQKEAEDATVRQAEEQRLKAEAAEREAARALEEQRLASEKALRDAEAERQRERDRTIKEAADRLAQAEAEARQKVADERLFDEIKASFPTLESAWVEIARLRKLAA